MKNASPIAVRAALLSALRQEGGYHNEQRLIMKQHVPTEAAAQRRFLGDFLIAANTHHWKKETLELLDEVYQSEAAAQDDDFISVDDIQSDPTATIVTTPNINSNNSSSSNNNTRLAVWRGDITKLKVDAIVNAANDQGLGCFVPNNHRCIDSVIHRAAGPRLRMACDVAMKERGGTTTPLLSAGTPPIVTPAFYLPSHWVIHVTGPQIPFGATVSTTDESNLVSAYRLSLDAAATAGAKSIAFPCISTGLFGYPQNEAAKVALSTVIRWIEENPGVLDIVVFDVFTKEDQQLYQQGLEEYVSTKRPIMDITVETPRDNNVSTTVDKMNRLAKTWIDEADAVLICAGAGMSVKEGEMVYTNPFDFAKHYPYFTKWGYKTAYEAMGLFGDQSVPATAKWAFWAKHLDNMRWSFEPNQGYDYLRELVGQKEHYFVVTSNVDGCFERAGFDASKIYTPQGDFGYVQCMKPCQEDSVYDARPYLKKLLPNISEDGHIPEDIVPHCPRCGSDMFGNVRGGSWFLHDKYKEGNKAAIEWMQAQLGKKIVVIEIGAGFNTPMVTRWPMESFVRETNGKLIRINPSDPEIPSDVDGLSYSEGWNVLRDILDASVIQRKDEMEAMSSEVHEIQGRDGRLMSATHQTTKVSAYAGHFDWRLFLQSLRK